MRGRRHSEQERRSSPARDKGLGQGRGLREQIPWQQVRGSGKGTVAASFGPTEGCCPLDSGRRAGTAGLTSGVRSGGFFFSACLAPGSTGEFMVAALAPVLPSLPLAHATAHSP